MQPTPIVLPVKFYGQRRLAGYGPWGLKESDITRLTEHVRKENLLYSTENSTQFSVIIYMERKSKKEWIYVYEYLINFAIQQKLTQHCNETQFSSVAQSCLALYDPMNRSTPGLLVYHQLPEFTQTHVHRVSDAIQPSHPLSSPSPPAPNPSQHQSLF